jgi:hypothetical protein
LIIVAVLRIDAELLKLVTMQRWLKKARSIQIRFSWSLVFRILLCVLSAAGGAVVGMYGAVFALMYFYKGRIEPGDTAGVIVMWMFLIGTPICAAAFPEIIYRAIRRLPK